MVLTFLANSAKISIVSGRYTGKFLLTESSYVVSNSASAY